MIIPRITTKEIGLTIAMIFAGLLRKRGNDYDWDCVNR
jgi:hypothetical protein